MNGAGLEGFPLDIPPSDPGRAVTLFDVGNSGAKHLIGRFVSSAIVLRNDAFDLAVLVEKYVLRGNHHTRIRTLSLRRVPWIQLHPQSVLLAIPFGVVHS